MSDEYEKESAAYEAERNRAWHSWFAAHRHISPTDEHTLIFDGGFRMAWGLERDRVAQLEAQLKAERLAKAEAIHACALANIELEMQQVPEPHRGRAPHTEGAPR